MAVVMHVVVTVRTNAIDPPHVEAFGPWDWSQCDRERKRLLANFAHEHPYESATGRFRATVVEVRDEVVAP